jgi:hypothetical protein
MSEPFAHLQFPADEDADPDSTPFTEPVPTLGKLTGKLTIRILEGRDFKPSIDPYVLCQFQGSTYVSEGATNSGSIIEDSPHSIRINNPHFPVDKYEQLQEKRRRRTEFGWQIVNPKWNHKVEL